MVRFSILIDQLATSGSIPIALGVEEHRYTKEYEEMEKISKELHDFLKEKWKPERDFDSYRAIKHLFAHLEKLMDYSIILNQKIYVNSFSDKYGNTFLQARSYLKNPDGKGKWITAYLGSTQNFQNGDQDVKALAKAKELIWEKMKSIFKIR